MKSKRFVPVKKLKNLYEKLSKLENEINSYNPQHCKVCGDTQPKHGFYPLWGMAISGNIIQTSGLMCNKCARTKEEYNKLFLKK